MVHLDQEKRKIWLRQKIDFLFATICKADYAILANFFIGNSKKIR